MEGDSLTENTYSERVESAIAEFRPEVNIVAEKNFCTVTQIEDHENGSDAPSII